MQNGVLELDIFSTGTVITSYYEVIDNEPIHNNDNEIVGYRDIRRIEKPEQEFVDRVEYRLRIKSTGAFYQWMVLGDSSDGFPGSQDCSMMCPLFNVQVTGGWVTRSKLIIDSLGVLDPALTLLVAHLCCTEFSVLDMKRDLKVQTPADLPMMGSMMGPPMGMLLNLL